MLKGYKFNQNLKVIKNKSAYAQEHRLFDDFLASGNENLRLEYSNRREAINARQALITYIQQNRKPANIAQRDCYVFIMRKEKQPEVTEEREF